MALTGQKHFELFHRESEDEPGIIKIGVIIIRGSTVVDHETWGFIDADEIIFSWNQ